MKDEILNKLMKPPKEIFKNNLRESLIINFLFSILGSYNIK